MDRPSGRARDALRAVTLETDVSKYAEGSCLAKFGDTHVLCTASIEDRVPSFLRNSGRGWVTAEYGMLPRATESRIDRRRAAVSGRTQEIQRQIRIDCDVLQADGGTRTAAITGGYVALHLAFQHMKSIGAIDAIPLADNVAAISCGLWEGAVVLDLDYAEDSTAQADANFVFTGAGGIVEVQATAEGGPFSQDRFDALMTLARKGVGELVALQNQALGK